MHQVSFQGPYSLQEAAEHYYSNAGGAATTDDGELRTVHSRNRENIPPALEDYLPRASSKVVTVSMPGATGAQEAQLHR